MLTRVLLVVAVAVAGVGVQRVAGQKSVSLDDIKRAAERGEPIEQMRLGLIYRSGQVVPQDFEEAMRWFRLAAEQGLADAQAMLGMGLASGQGAPRNLVEAHKWLNLA